VPGVRTRPERAPSSTAVPESTESPGNEKMEETKEMRGGGGKRRRRYATVTGRVSRLRLISIASIKRARV